MNSPIAASSFHCQALILYMPVLETIFKPILQPIVVDTISRHAILLLLDLYLHQSDSIIRMRSKIGLRSLTFILSSQDIRIRQNTRILKGAESLDVRVVSIVVALPAKLARFAYAANGQPGLSNGPIEEVPGTPLESFELAAVLGYYSLPYLLLVLVPLSHEEVVRHTLLVPLSRPLSELGNLKIVSRRKPRVHVN